MASENEQSLPEGVEVQRDLAFATGGSAALRADIYSPSERHAAPVPAVLYVHGGGWSMRNRDQFSRHATHMATRGFVGMCCEYRLSDEAVYPAALIDTYAALRYMTTHADPLGIDTTRMAVVGGSAGGHLALLAAFWHGAAASCESAPDGGERIALKAAVGFNPVVDLREMRMDAVSNFMGGDPETVGADRYREASPICHVQGGALPAVLLLHGDQDTLVPHAQSVAFRDAVVAAGGIAELFTAEGCTHAFFNSAPWFEPTLQRMAAFLQERV
jgi:acetyl esterase/lipase